MREKQTTDTLGSLAQAESTLRVARNNRRKADKALSMAEASLAKAQEQEGAAEASYKAARGAVLKAYPEHNSA